MPRFQIIPTEHPENSVEIDCLDAGSALHVAHRLHCAEADVHQDGDYLFSIRTLGGKSSFWQIFQRAEVPENIAYVPFG